MLRKRLTCGGLISHHVWVFLGKNHHSTFLIKKSSKRNIGLKISPQFVKRQGRIFVQSKTGAAKTHPA